MKKLLLPSLLLLAYNLAWAETPEEKGLAIAVEADKRDLGFGDSQATLDMTLRNKHGDESHRELRIKTLEVTGDGDKSLTVFDKPADVKGTALLTFTHGKKPDDQWLYLPALKRIKRISSSNKSGPFMGSEFAFEDFGSQEIEKYRYKWLRDESYANQDCFVSERYPEYEDSGYTRQAVWLDKQHYRILKVEFYDRKDALLKTLTLDEYHQYLDKYWRAHKLTMINHQTGKSTVLEWKDYQFKTGLSDADFNQNSLSRAK